MKRWIKRLAKETVFKITRTKQHLKRSINCEHEWYGSEYGGFYVCPSLLNSQSVVYSFGVGEDISFACRLVSAGGINACVIQLRPLRLEYSVEPVPIR